jgi:predicted nucleotidyltransferase
MLFQPLFRKFELAIQLKRFDENAELREKRDKILTRLRGNLKQTFEHFPQGSYAMGTGVKPLNGDYDIDVGIVFNIDYRAYDPVIVKGWVHSAVETHTARVEWRRPCITVYYQEGGEPIYHVDLAILAKDPYSNGLRLALGKEHSSAELRQWQPDDRRGFMQAIEQRFSGEDAAQFRRAIRYLKRWKDVHFAREGRAAPTGLCLTVAAYLWFQPARGYTNGQLEYDDLGALSSLVLAMLRNFRHVWDNGRTMPRLSLTFPNAPHDDVCERMTNQQMLEFHGRLTELSAWLEEARRAGAVEPLRRAFGKDFPEK